MTEIFVGRPEMPKPGKTCNVTDCAKSPAWQAGLRLWARGKRGGPLQLEMGLFLCDEHMKVTRVSNLVNDEAWKQICAAVHMIGKEEPDRRLTELYMIPILSL